MTAAELSQVLTEISSQQNTVSPWAYIAMAGFSLLGVGLGAFLARLFENSADNLMLQSQLNRIEQTVKAQKSIEERIAHSFLEQREVAKVKREKIEEIFQYLEEDVKAIQDNALEALHEGRLTREFGGLRLHTLISLYFSREMNESLSHYQAAVVELRRFLQMIVTDELPKNEVAPAQNKNEAAKEVVDDLLKAVYVADSEIRKDLNDLMESLLSPQHQTPEA